LDQFEAQEASKTAVPVVTQEEVPGVEESESPDSDVAATALPPLIPSTEDEAATTTEDVSSTEKSSPETPATTTPDGMVRREYQPVEPMPLDTIAESFGVSVAEIRQWNDLADEVTMADSTVVVYLPVAAESVQEEVPAPPEPEPLPAYDGPYNTHVIQPGDTLRNIAQRYNTTVQKLIEMNQLANPDVIVLGRELKVPVTN
jgi:LysM repeat protein